MQLHCGSCDNICSCVLKPCMCCVEAVRAAHTASAYVDNRVICGRSSDYPEINTGSAYIGLVGIHGTHFINQKCYGSVDCSGEISLNSKN